MDSKYPPDPPKWKSVTGMFSTFPVLLPILAAVLGFTPNGDSPIPIQDLATATAPPYLIVIFAYLIGGNFRPSGSGASGTHALVYRSSGAPIRAATMREAYNHQHNSGWAWDEMITKTRITIIWGGLLIGIAAAFLPLVWPKIQPTPRQWIVMIVAAVSTLFMFISCGVLRAAFFWALQSTMHRYSSYRNPETEGDHRRATILLLISLLAHLLQIVGVIPILIVLFNGSVAPWILTAGTWIFAYGLCWQLIQGFCALPSIRSFKEVWS